VRHSDVQPAIEKLLQSRRHFLSFLRKRLHHADDAEELLQAAFLKALEKGGEIRDQEKIAAWFYRMLRNSVIDYYRKAGRITQELTGIPVDLEQHAIAASEPQNEICYCIHPLLENIKPEYREALNTIDLAGGSIRDLAKRAGITEGNAAVRVHRAREAMRKQIHLACGACAEHDCIDCDCRRA
jgi:RNA polymerase sigma-70 factor (ECF subfamily)